MNKTLNHVDRLDRLEAIIIEIKDLFTSKTQLICDRVIYIQSEDVFGDLTHDFIIISELGCVYKACVWDDTDEILIHGVNIDYDRSFSNV